MRPSSAPPGSEAVADAPHAVKRPETPGEFDGDVPAWTAALLEGSQPPADGPELPAEVRHWYKEVHWRERKRQRDVHGRDWPQRPREVWDYIRRLESFETHEHNRLAEKHGWPLRETT